MRTRRAAVFVVVVLATGSGLARAQAPGQTPQEPDKADSDSTDHSIADSDDDPDDSSPAPEEVTTGALRLGVYGDTDQTSVLRTVGQVTGNWGTWSLTGNATLDAVTSASVDVRSSPLGEVDVVTSASGRSSTTGGQMTDRRLQTTGGGAWNDGDGHAAAVTTSFAVEADYASVGGGLNGSTDLLDRSITMLGGANVTRNWIYSVIDRQLRESMYSVGWSGGVAWVMTPNAALRLRYDGTASEGYQASPYRNVRFGDWTTTTNRFDQISFENTIGSADGLPENVPRTRVSHAATLELVYALGDGVGLHPSVRLGRDTWGIRSLTAAADLRIAKPTWRTLLGYRFYRQSAADFYESKYTMDPSMYTFYTADKELGTEIGHAVDFDFSVVLRPSRHLGETRLLLSGQLSAMYYQYPDFVLLDARAGVFAGVGLVWEQ